MKSTETIERLTASSVKTLCDFMAPSCVGCCHANSFVSVSQRQERDTTIVKVNTRCERMGMLGPACPDGGTPGETYIKDIGITRRLGEQQISKSFDISNLDLKGSSRHVEAALKSPEYIKHIKAIFQEQSDDLARQLHEINETLNFVTNNETLATPILWNGETKFESFNIARSVYITEHIMPYSKSVDHTRMVIEPTPYMGKYFPKQYQRPFGIFTDPPDSAKRGRPVAARKDMHEGVTFLGDDLPRKPKIYIPPPTQDDLYEDWGTFA